MEPLELVAGILFIIVYWVLAFAYVLELNYGIKLDKQNRQLSYDSYSFDWLISSLGLLLFTVVSWNAIFSLILYFCYFLLALLI